MTIMILAQIISVHFISYLVVSRYQNDNNGSRNITWMFLPPLLFLFLIIIVVLFLHNRFAS